jgi:hypothetical protein
MGVVIETCAKYPGGRTRIRGTDLFIGQSPISVISGGRFKGDQKSESFYRARSRLPATG